LLPYVKLGKSEFVNEYSPNSEIAYVFLKSEREKEPQKASSLTLMLDDFERSIDFKCSHFLNAFG
jgi:hypothetical protein